MGTNAVIVDQGDNYGRYVHYDGFVDHMGPALHRMMRRLGYARTVEALIEQQPGGWSSLINDDVVVSLGRDQGRNEFGVYYKGDEVWTDVDNVEWVYRLYDDRIEVTHSRWRIGNIWLLNPNYRLAATDEAPPLPPISWKAAGHA